MRRSTPSTSSTGDDTSQPTRTPRTTSSSPWRRRAETALDDASVAAEEAGVDVVTEMRDGIPHKTIIDYTGEIDADVVAMGTHGRTGRDRVANLGSVTGAWVKSSEVPVLVVRIEWEGALQGPACPARSGSCPISTSMILALYQIRSISILRRLPDGNGLC